MAGQTDDKAIEIPAEASVSKVPESVVNETQSGFNELTDSYKAQREALKAGGRSGVTGEFGKADWLLDAIGKAQSNDSDAALAVALKADKSANSDALDVARNSGVLGDRTVRKTLPNGADATIHVDDEGYITETVKKDGNTLTVNRSPDRSITSQEFVGKDGGKLVVAFSDGKPLNTTYTEPGGKHFIELKESKVGDQTVVTGVRKDAAGNVVENVRMIDDKLVFEDVKTHAKRAASFEAPTNDRLSFQMTDLGKYDEKTGTITQTDKGVEVRHAFGGGRVEMEKDGFVTSYTHRGDEEIYNKKTGEASVRHADNTGARLNADGTIERWGPNPGDNAKGEKFLPSEQAYLKKHPEIDVTDLLEIHRKFHGDQKQLDNFYKSLEKLDASKNLTDPEKAAIRKDVMYHVAYPAEIYQGATQSCNVAVIERDMAMTNPAKYAATVVEAVTEGTIHTADGKAIKLDVKNLKMADSSGRDLASRVFQTSVLVAEFHPTKKFVNTPDGLGQLRPGEKNQGSNQPESFNGLFPGEIAEIRQKLTGEEKTIGVILNEAELKKAVDQNGLPMTIAVDAHSPPFGKGPQGDANHVVTITGVEAGPPVKYLVQNQWGADADHSTKGSAIPADALVKNMKGQAGKAGMLMVKGDHNKLITVGDGSVDNTKPTYLEQQKARRYKT